MLAADRLLETLRALRGPEGCPWDREQTLESLRSGFLEEVHEFLDALDRRDAAEAKAEWGDVVFNLWFYAELAREAGWFDAESALEAVREKLIQRHPHVFGEERKVGMDAAEVLRRWEVRKAEENRRKGQQRRSLLEGISRGLPPTARAARMVEKARRVDAAPDTAPADLRAALEAFLTLTDPASSEPAEAPLGRLLFALIAEANRRGLDADRAVTLANRDFLERFHRMEAASTEPLPEVAHEVRQDLWRRAGSGDDSAKSP